MAKIGGRFHMPCIGLECRPLAPVNDGGLTVLPIASSLEKQRELHWDPNTDILRELDLWIDSEYFCESTA